MVEKLKLAILALLGAGIISCHEPGKGGMVELTPYEQYDIDKKTEMETKLQLKQQADEQMRQHHEQFTTNCVDENAQNVEGDVDCIF